MVVNLRKRQVGRTTSHASYRFSGGPYSPDWAWQPVSPPVPDSGKGVGFGNYQEYLSEKEAREAELARTAVPPAGYLVAGNTQQLSHQYRR